MRLRWRGQIECIFVAGEVNEHHDTAVVRGFTRVGRDGKIGHLYAPRTKSYYMIHLLYSYQGYMKYDTFLILVTVYVLLLVYDSTFVPHSSTYTT